jgi:hypothetical protein
MEEGADFAQFQLPFSIMNNFLHQKIMIYWVAVKLAVEKNPKF